MGKFIEGACWFVTCSFLAALAVHAGLNEGVACGIGLLTWYVLVGETNER